MSAIDPTRTPPLPLPPAAVGDREVDPKKYGVDEAYLQKSFQAAQAFFNLNIPGFDIRRMPKEMTKNKHTQTYSKPDKTLIIHLKKKIEGLQGRIGKGDNKKVYYCLLYNGERVTLRADLTVFKMTDDVAAENKIAQALLDSGATHTVEPGSHVIGYQSFSQRHIGHSRIFMSMPLYDFNLNDKEMHEESYQAKLEMMQGAALGVAEMHKLGIVHRDLKLPNILVKKEIIDGKTHFCAKVGDFGYATYEKDLSKCQKYTKNGYQTVGNRASRPPEVYSAVSAAAAVLKQTKEADVWGLGIMLHQLFFSSERNIVFPSFVHSMHVRLPISQSSIDQYLEALPKTDKNGNDMTALIELMADCLKYEPRERITAEDAADRLRKLYLNTLAPIPVEDDPLEPTPVEDNTIEPTPVEDDPLEPTPVEDDTNL